MKGEILQEFAPNQRGVLAALVEGTTRQDRPLSPILIALATLRADCNPDGRQSIARSTVRIPVSRPISIQACEPAKATSGITTERQLARLSSEQLHASGRLY
ncbi:MAG: hypothetical protein LCH88_19515 [Proteobacteria bacterium]|nr:hypothetical protein [Pseudomonadota bacterium]